MTSAYKLTLIYLLAGLLWIWVTDHLSFSLADELPLSPEKVQNAKGYLFVLLSGVLVFGLMRRMEHNGRKALRLASSVIEGLPLGIAVHRLEDGKVINVNANFAKIHGMSVEEVNDVSSYLRTAFPDRDYRGSVRQRVTQDIAHAGGSQVHWPDLTIHTRQGEQRTVDAYSIVLAEERLVVTAMHDTTGRKALEQSVRQLSTAVEQSPVSVMITGLDGNIAYVNPWFERATGYKLNEVLGKNPRILNSGHTTGHEYKDLWQTITSGSIWTGEFLNRRKDGSLFWERASIGPITDQNGNITSYIAIKEDITELKNALDTLEQRVNERTETLRNTTDKLKEALNDTLDSMQYAKRIQQAMLPSVDTLHEGFGDCFALYLPRNIVSGDFYWCHQSDSRLLVAVGDCTGHGVPGALLSMLGMELLDRIVIKEGCTDPASVMRQLDLSLSHILSRNNRDSAIHDGMEIGFISIDRSTDLMQYCLIQTYGVIADEDGLRDMTRMKHSIAGHRVEEDKEFITTTEPLTSGSRIYLFTDGFQDQFGGSEGRKLTRRRLLKELADLQHLPMGQQSARLEAQLNGWRGSEPQVDDITLLGLELQPALRKG
jgi:PAS domain S-box-containing protein